MKKTNIIFALLALTLAACQPAAGGPTETASPLPPTPTQFVPATTTPPPQGDLTPAQSAAVNVLADTLGIAADQITVVSTESVEWPNSCLGILVHGLACAEAITPGFNIMLEAEGLPYEYHTDADGTSVWGANLGMYWSRAGGIAGFCDDAWIFRTGEIYAVSCKNGGAFPKARLSTEQARQLADWVRAFGTVSITSADPAVADAMELRLDLNGLGGGQPDEAEKTAMMNWGQAVYEQATP